MRMEQFQMNQTSFRRSQDSLKQSTLRKYSLAICFLEAIVILFMVYLLVWYPANNNSKVTLSDPYDEVTYETFSNGVNSTKLVLGLIKNCNQRKHDLTYGVKCQSKSIESLCEPLTAPGYSEGKDTTTLSATVITTSRDGLRFNTQHGVPIKKIYCSTEHENQQKTNTTKPLESCRFITKLHVYPNDKQQEIIGWGGALTDSSINAILSLTTNGTEQLLNDYFGQDGLKFNIVRITIGGSDFSSRFYTNDDLLVKNQTTANDNQDFKLEQFRLRAEDLLYKIPALQFIQERYKENDVKLFASMWSPPTWMKTNEHFNKGMMKGSIGFDTTIKYDERYFKSLAELKKKFILAYLEQSIKFWGLTIMNEPIFARQPFLNFNTMIFPSIDYAAYLSKYLGPIMKQDKRLENIKLIIHDDNRRYLRMYSSELLKSPETLKYIDGISTHGYIDEDYELMDEMLELAKSSSKAFMATKTTNYFILPTELCSGHLPWMEKALIGNWFRGVHYALDIIRSLQHSAAGWVDWNMALDVEGGPGWLGGRLDSPIIIDKQLDSYYRSPMFYVLGHFSRYIPPGSVKINSQTLNDLYDYPFETVTFILKDSKTLVTVALNHNPYEVELNIKAFRDKDDHKEEAYHQFKCTPNSVTTFIYPTRF